MEDSNLYGQRKNLLAQLIKLSKIDGELHENEFIFLLRIAEKLQINEDELRTIQFELDDYVVNTPSSEVERMTILYYLLFLMKSDGKATESEKELIHHMGFKLGFNQMLTDEMIQVVANNLDKPIEPEKLIEKIKKYMN